MSWKEIKKIQKNNVWKNQGDTSGRPSATSTTSSLLPMIITIRNSSEEFKRLALNVGKYFQHRRSSSCYGRLRGIQSTKSLHLFASKPIKLYTCHIYGKIAFYLQCCLNNVSSVSSMVVRFPNPLADGSQVGTLSSSMDRGAFFVWRAPILRWPRIMCSQVRMLNFLEPSREMP